MPILLPIISGFVFRHLVLSGLGSALVALNLPPEAAEQVVALVQTLGPVSGTALGIVLIGASLVWSFWQKKKSGVIENQ